MDTPISAPSPKRKGAGDTGEEGNRRGNATSPGRQACVPGQTSKSLLALTEPWAEAKSSASGDPQALCASPEPPALHF